MNCYFDTFADAVDAVQVRLDADRIELVFGTVNTPPADHWVSQVMSRGPLAYGETRRHDFEILRQKDKPRRAWFHIQIYRCGSSGRYELNTYVL